EWLFSRAWGLALGLTTFMTVYLTLGLALVISARTRTPRLWEHALIVIVIATGICEVLRRTILPAVSFDERVAIPVSILTGLALALWWSGIALRRPAAAGDPGLERLIAPARGQGVALVFGLVILPQVMGAALRG